MDPPDLERLRQRVRGQLWGRIRRGTNAVSFVRVEAGGDLLPQRPLLAPAEKARLFFVEYGDLFGIRNVDAELIAAGSSVDPYGATHLTFRQVFRSVPVFGGELRAHFDANGNLITVNGVTVPNIALDTTPQISPAAADAVAVETVLAQLESGVTDMAAIARQLYIFRDGLLEGVPGPELLVYEVEVANPARTVREFIYVDAHSGQVVEQISGIQGLDREVSEGSLENVVWDESRGDPEPIPPGWAGGSAEQVGAWNDEIAGARETYNLFASLTNGAWLSYDGNDATMRTVNNDPNIACPNANWNGTSTNYCTGVTGDDTVAHEWGHAYTEYTSNLIYLWQSGALNESYSDIWGEVVDLLNSRGTDAPDAPRTANSCSLYGDGFPRRDDSYRWLSGEDDPAFGGAIRDMWNPRCYGHPDSVSALRYHCRISDGGGVHINSGVPNHLFALLVDGGTFNGVTVDPIGLTRAAHLHWHAQRFYLTPASDFVDHADALTASCTDLLEQPLFALSTAGPDTWGAIAADSITTATCDAVARAIDAVELRAEPRCRTRPLLDPDAPALCTGSGTVQSFWLTDWEDGLETWAVGSRAVVSPTTFAVPDWSVVGDLPDARAGLAAFGPDPINAGDCAANDTSGIIYLESEVITIPVDAFVPRLAFDHWVATEQGFDGGNLKIRVNGGDWIQVPAGAFTFNAYNGFLYPFALNTNPMAGERAFTGTNQGSVSGSWGQSQLNLSGLAAPGDTIQLRFELGVDGCNGVTGWYVDDVHAYSCSLDAQSPFDPHPQNGTAGSQDHRIFLPTIR